MTAAIRARRWTPLTAAVILLAALPVLAQSPASLAGRRLDEALRLLQGRGLRVVFSSELVTPVMRVAAEPRPAALFDQLVEVLEPHGLVAERGPSGLVQVVRRRTPRVPRAQAQALAPSPPRDAGIGEASPGPAERNAAPDVSYRERVVVTAPTGTSMGAPRGMDQALDARTLTWLGGSLAEDPLRAVQALAGVAGGDDFRSDLSVRGSQYRHAATVVDGVPAPWLQHAAYGRGDTGTLTMMGGEALRDATLLVGAYPRIDGSQLGPEVRLTLREGSRAARATRASVNGTTTALGAEGPIGRAARGSWIVNGRKSHVEWPAGRSDHDSTVFGFADAQSKLAYDVTSNQRVSASLVAGFSNIERDDANPLSLLDGTNRAGLASAAWQSVLSQRTVVTQRVFTNTHEFVNRDHGRGAAGRGVDRADGYRVDVSRDLFGATVDVGGTFRRVRGSRHGVSFLAPPSDLLVASTQPISIDTSWLERAGHASFSRAVTAAVTVGGGLRVADSTLVGAGLVDRWFQATWAPRPRWTIHGSAGVGHQLPGIEGVGVDNRGTPERATYADVGLRTPVSPLVQFGATVFVRREEHVRRDVGIAPSLLGFEERVSGDARGIELRIDRTPSDGLSGWLAYSYGVARYHGAAGTFPADFDQRHTLSAVGTVPITRSLSVGATFRAGSNVPIPGYVVARGSRFFAGDAPNQVRLPPYARLDLRVEQAVRRARAPVTLFAEVVNVLNRSNLGLASGVVRPDTGKAVGLTERLFPRLLNAGIRLTF